tara:strand:- start:6663 stop:7760 length:1098 start_codon:yes stop_codon:yes gene_type:complete
MTQEHHHTKKRKIRKSRIITPIIIFLLIFSIYILTQSNEISVTIIKNNDCEFCTDVQPIIDLINQSKEVKINYLKQLDYKDQEAKSLINKLSIKTVPIVIIEGNAFTKTDLFNELSSDQIQKQANKFLIGNIKPPLTVIETDEIIGTVNVVYLKDKECKECADLNHAINKFKDMNIYIKEVKEIDIDSKQGMDLIQRHNIKNIPTLIFDTELKYYEDIKDNWKLYGTIEDNGFMIMRKVLAPYKELETNEIKGLIKITYITDKKCTQCYDPLIHKQVISRIMPYYDDEQTLDISNNKAKELIKKYNIKTIPTIILSEDINEYPLFESLFGNVFEKQIDKTYVFKQNQDLKDVSYKNLESNEIIIN